MCPQNYHRESLTFCKHGGNRTLTKKALNEIKLLWNGGPENRFEELLDVKATVSALINTTIFEHPTQAMLSMGAPRL
jgi:hypothetical protein